MPDPWIQGFGDLLFMGIVAFVLVGWLFTAVTTRWWKK